MSKLQEILNKKQITQKQLAILTGLTETYISYFISGKRGMSLETAKKIAKALNVKIDDFA